MFLILDVKLIDAILDNCYAILFANVQAFMIRRILFFRFYEMKKKSLVKDHVPVNIIILIKFTADQAVAGFSHINHTVSTLVFVLRSSRLNYFVDYEFSNGSRYLPFQLI